MDALNELMAAKTFALIEVEVMEAEIQQHAGKYRDENIVEVERLEHKLLEQEDYRHASVESHF